MSWGIVRRVLEDVGLPDDAVILGYGTAMRAAEGLVRAKVDAVMQKG